jgi:hypothetical protein
MAASESGPTRAADVGWLLVGFVAAALVIAQLIGTALVVAYGPRGMAIVQGLGGSLCAWWFARGSWLRTRWGRPPTGSAPPWAEPTLTPRRASRFVWLGAACVVATSLAIGIQALSWID